MSRSLGAATTARRPVTARDLPLLRSLFADAHVELSVLPSDTRFVLVDMQFRAQRRQHAERHPHAEHQIVTADGVDVGRLIIDRSTSRWQLVDLTVALGYRREGIATAVLTDLVADAVTARRQVSVTVRNGNLAARALCERVGLCRVNAASESAGYLTFDSSLTPAG